MRQIELAFGVVMVVVGLGFAVWAFGEAENMGLLRFVYPEEYEFYNTAGLAGIGMGALGAGLAIHGLASKDPQESQRPCQPMMFAPSGQAMFCRYCGGRVVPGNRYCGNCGRDQG